MNLARRVLRETNKSVVDVALDVGYANPSHFAKLAEKPACPQATTVASVDLRFAADFRPPHHFILRFFEESVRSTRQRKAWGEA
jgi:AraC-like DNA-binding protein